MRTAGPGGDHSYVKKGGGRWVIGNLTARARANDEHALNPYASLAMFGKLPGVRRVSPGHYSVTGPFAKISPFVRYEFGLPANAFAGSGRSASNVFAATGTFAHYNKPVTITSP
jgi:hypothetical protein